MPAASVPCLWRDARLLQTRWSRPACAFARASPGNSDNAYVLFRPVADQVVGTTITSPHAAQAATPLRGWSSSRCASWSRFIDHCLNGLSGGRRVGRLRASDPGRASAPAVKPALGCLWPWVLTARDRQLFGLGRAQLVPDSCYRGDVLVVERCDEVA